MQEKLAIVDSKCVGKQNNTSSQKCSEWSVQCLTLLDLFLWIFGVLNDMFVSGLFSKHTISSTVINYWSCSLHYAYASVCWFHAFGRCCMLPKSLLITFPLFLSLQFIIKNFASILQKLYFLNQYKFLIRALSPLLNAHYLNGISSVH